MSDSEGNLKKNGDARMPSVTSGSVEDLSEYTDADESVSAPTEILAEFLSAIMLKDYETALKYCKLILEYEPNNSTAKEFYPLITEKIEMGQTLDDDDDEDDGTSSEPYSENSISSSHQSLSSCEESECIADSDATSASYSSLEDDEADSNTNASSETDLTSNDIANGNTTVKRESNESAFSEGRGKSNREFRLKLKDARRINNPSSESFNGNNDARINLSTSLRCNARPQKKK